MEPYKEIIDERIISSEDFSFVRKQIKVNLEEGFEFKGSLILKKRHGAIEYSQQMVKYGYVK